MPIYSKNRSGAVGAVVETGTYGSNDAGRVLYESCINDKTLFDAMIKHDMKEIQGLKEGTILESEVAALNEASVKELVTKIKEGLKKFWKKLKQIFADAMNKISAYVLGDCKAFAKEFKAAKEKYSGSKATISGRFPKMNYNIKNKLDVNVIIGSRMKNVRYGGELEVNRAEILGTELAKIAGGSGSMTPKEFREYVMQDAFEAKSNVSIGDAVVTDMVHAMETGLGESIKRIKNYEKSCEVAIEAAQDLQDRMLKDNEKTYEENYQKMVSLVSVTQQILSNVCSTAIAVEKGKFAAARKALGALMAAMKSESKGTEAKNESVLTALVEASIEIDDAFEGGPKDVDKEVSDFVDSIEADVPETDPEA